jgi:hypothetical protein
MNVLVDPVDQADLPGEDDGGRKPSQSTLLLQLAEDAFDFGQTSTGEPFAVPKPGQGPHVARLLRGRGGSLRAELARRYVAAHGRAPNQQALADALLVVQGRCQLAPRVELALRVARHGAGVVLDLGDETGRAVVVTPDGWELVDRSPVLFRRTELTGALPEPKAGGDPDRLRGLLNVPGGAWPLLVAWELAALLRPDIPHPVIALTGEHGAAKSTTQWILARLLDPASPQHRQAPRDVEAWTVAAAGSLMVALDNLSGMPDWLSDAICRAVTGDGLVRRALYTDGDLSVLSFRRCVLLNGIAFAHLRGDLADRLLQVECERVDDDRRLEDADVHAAFVAAWPSALGGLLDLAVKVLGALPDVRLDRKPRMADFARVVAAADQVLGTDALGTYLKLRQRTAEEVLDSDLVAAAVRRFALDRKQWEGTASELLAEVTPERPPKGWPATPRAMAARLKRAAPTLRATGVQVDHLGRQGHDRMRTWSLQAERTRIEPSAPSQPASGIETSRSDRAEAADGHADDWTRAGATDRATDRTSGDQTRRSEGRADDVDAAGGSMPHLSGDADDASAPTRSDSTGLSSKLDQEARETVLAARQRAEREQP